VEGKLTFREWEEINILILINFLLENLHDKIQKYIVYIKKNLYFMKLLFLIKLLK
jgi:hypothetical protein